VCDSNDKKCWHNWRIFASPLTSELNFIYLILPDINLRVLFIRFYCVVYKHQRTIEDIRQCTFSEQERENKINDRKEFLCTRRWWMDRVTKGSLSFVRSMWGKIDFSSPPPRILWSPHLTPNWPFLAIKFQLKLLLASKIRH
jgi:hypothetical protein